MGKNDLNREILRQMRGIYYPKDKEYKDWMGYPITDNNKPSYHHIVKKEELKRLKQKTDATVKNGAYLGKRSHEKLHHIEILDEELYECWNYIFLVINRMKTYPIEDVWKMIEGLQNSSEELLHQDTKVLKKKKKEVGRRKEQ